MNENNKNWIEIAREKGELHFDRGVDRVTFRLPSGRETDFFISTGHPSIACLALTKDKQVILIREFRPGPAEVLLELPGGGVNVGESLETAIARELLEETGYRGEVTVLTSVLPSAYANYTKNAAIIVDCVKVTEPKREDNGEEVEVVLLSLEDFRRHIRSGHMTDVEIAYLGLDYLGLL